MAWVVSLVGDHTLPAGTFEVSVILPEPQMVVEPLEEMVTAFVVPMTLTSSSRKTEALFFENRILRLAVDGTVAVGVKTVQVVDPGTFVKGE
jgi:hypothetical protein